VVLSGAYTVLRGAPALVTAVSRFAFADRLRPADFLTPEVRCALEELSGTPAAPWFDASALRERGEKLGLGSSAAILVASLGALLSEAYAKDPAAWRQEIYGRALRAHRAAQGGGSGIDVAASSFGGTLLAQLEHPGQVGPGAPALRVQGVSLPSDLTLEIWALGQPASTAQFVRRVFDLERSDPRTFHGLLEVQADAARAAVEAVEAASAQALVDSLRAQFHALDALGRAAGVPIVVESLRELEPLARATGAFLPAGAGGGDISIYAGLVPSSSAFRSAAAARGLWQLELDCGAPGVDRVPAGPPEPPV
jgi:phosphomevalonate kinase